MNKVIFTSSLVLLLGLSLNTRANNTDIKGFIDEAITIITVTDAEKMNDDTNVTLKGKIEKHLDDDKYIFTDETGDITVEIDDDAWMGASVGTKDVVIINGEIDKDINSIEIDVDSVTKVD